MSNCAVCHQPVKSGIVVHSECMELLQKTQQVENKPMEWISVKDRLPDAGFEAIVSVRIFGKCISTTGRYDAGKKIWYCTQNNVPAPVTHWMPLPEPPEVEI